MRDMLARFAESFIENREIVRSAFRMESDFLYPVCANVFCARGATADRERLLEAKRLVKESTGVFSNFRGALLAPAACMLSLEEDGAARMRFAVECYDALRRRFMGSAYLALAAFLLSGMVSDAGEAREKADAARGVYDLMRGEHPFLTGREDSVFAVLLAMPQRDGAALVRDMEASYTLLGERFGGRNARQSASHVLAMAPGGSRDKAARMIRLYDALANAGRKFGRDYELAVLAAASILEADEDALAQDILDADAYLAGQKGYGGLLGTDKRRRLMHAAMIASDCYAPRDAMDPAAMASAISMIAAQQAAMCAVIASSASSSAASVHS